MEDFNSNRLALPHAWTVLAILAGLFGVIMAQLIGHSCNEIAATAGEAKICFGWPAKFLGRIAFESPNGWIADSDWWIFGNTMPYFFRPWILGFDATFCFACLVITAYSVEQFCRRYRELAQFRVVTLLGLTTWIAMVFGWEIAIANREVISMVLILASLIRIVILLICCVSIAHFFGWLLTKHYHRIADWPNRST